MNIPKEGSKWTSSNNVFVVVLHTIDLDNHTWVHYRKESSDQAYSCYVESFLERFTPVL